MLAGLKVGEILEHLEEDQMTLATQNA